MFIYRNNPSEYYFFHLEIQSSLVRAMPDMSTDWEKEEHIKRNPAEDSGVLIDKKLNVS